jgi:hypothetical protein
MKSDTSWGDQTNIEEIFIYFIITSLTTFIPPFNAVVETLKNRDFIFNSTPSMF